MNKTTTEKTATDTTRSIKHAIMTWLNFYRISMSELTTDIFHLSYSNSRSLFLFHDWSPDLWQE